MYLNKENSLAETRREPKGLGDVVDHRRRKAEYQHQQIRKRQIRQEEIHRRPLKEEFSYGIFP